jgi:hypothetical protein
MLRLPERLRLGIAPTVEPSLLFSTLSTGQRANSHVCSEQSKGRADVGGAAAQPELQGVWGLIAGSRVHRASRRLLRALSQCADRCTTAITLYIISRHNTPQAGIEKYTCSKRVGLIPPRRPSASASDSLPLRLQSSNNILAGYENHHSYHFSGDRGGAHIENGKMEECSRSAAIAATSWSACSRGIGGKPATLHICFNMTGRRS